MRLSLISETRDEYFSFELAHAARRLIEEVLEVKPDQQVVITADTLSDRRVTWATAQACFAAGAMPIVITYPTREQAQTEPPSVVAAALTQADIWIEYANAYIMYTQAWHEAIQAGAQYCAFGSLDVDGMVRCFGRSDVKLMDQFAQVLIELLTDCQSFRLTTDLGTEIQFSNRGVEIGAFQMRANPQRIPIMMPGQVSWSPVESSLQGQFVADGILYPPTEVGMLTETVTLQVEKGQITQISGGRAAQLLQNWIEALGDDTLYRIAHTSYGFNPGIRVPSGRITEDERAFGCFNCGWGAWVGRPAAGHFDVTAMNVSSWVDDQPIAQGGIFVHPELRRLCQAMGVPRH